MKQASINLAFSQKICQNCVKFSQNFTALRKYLIIFRNSTIVREIPIKIGMKIDEIYKKIVNFRSKITKIFEKSPKNIDEFSEFFEFGAVQRIANLVDLEKRCKMSTSIWLQKSALIQPRTSSPKFA